MTPERRERIHSVLSKRQPDLTLVTDHVVKERNLAAVVRTCDAVGIPTMHSVTDAEPYRTYRGTSASAQKYVDVKHHSTAVDILRELRGKGYNVVAANLSDQAIDYREVDYTRPTALLMGAEIEGVSSSALAFVDTQVVIPMMGMVESFNVSVAAAVILSEAQRQRQVAGMYDRVQLAEDDYKSLFFRWAYPRFAEYCDQNGLAYPELDENDDLIPGVHPELLGSE